jgi:hypothetical protein
LSSTIDPKLQRYASASFELHGLTLIDNYALQPNWMGGNR